MAFGLNLSPISYSSIIKHVHINFVTFRIFFTGIFSQRPVSMLSFILHVLYLHNDLALHDNKINNVFF